MTYKLRVLSGILMLISLVVFSSVINTMEIIEERDTAFEEGRLYGLEERKK
jgi:hypothetical protein